MASHFWKEYSPGKLIADPDVDGHLWRRTEGEQSWQCDRCDEPRINTPFITIPGKSTRPCRGRQP